MTFECLHIDKAGDSTCTCIEAVDCFDVADCGAIGDSVDRVAEISVICDKISVVVAVSVVVGVVVLCVFVVVGGGGGGGVVLGVVEAGVVDDLDDSSVIVLVLKVDECFAVDVEKLRSPLQLRLRTALTLSTIIINMMYANNLVISV